MRPWSAAAERRPGTGGHRPRPPWGPSPPPSAAPVPFRRPASATTTSSSANVPQRPSRADSTARRRGPSPRVASSRVADFRPLISEGRNPKRRAASGNAAPLDPRVIPAWRQRADDFLTAARLERAAPDSSELRSPSSSEPDVVAAAASTAAAAAASPPPNLSGDAALERRMDKRLPLEFFDGDESFEPLRQGGAAAAVGRSGRVRIREPSGDVVSFARPARAISSRALRHFATCVLLRAMASSRPPMRASPCLPSAHDRVSAPSAGGVCLGALRGSRGCRCCRGRARPGAVRR